MILVLAEESMIPGRRLELVEAHERVGQLLAREPGFIGARLLHFAGGAYRYLYEMGFRSRDDWEAFFAGPGFLSMRLLIDPHLTVPLGVQVHGVVSEHSAGA